MKLRRIAKITVLCALLMFFTPFMMVSCSEAGASETYSGMELIMCSTEDDSLIASASGSVDEDEFSPNIFLIGTFICGVAALIVLFVKKSNLLPAALSAASALLLIIFRASFVSYYNLEEYENYLQIKTKWGYVICLLLMIISAICCIIPQDLMDVVIHRKPDDTST